MSTELIGRFLMWCTIINTAMLILSFTLMAAAGSLAYRLHGRFFPMPRETFNVVIYTLLGMYKIIILAFNIIPWIAISIIG